MAKTINEQIVELQSENDHLKKLQKLFERAVKDEFGVDTKTIPKSSEIPAILKQKLLIILT